MMANSLGGWMGGCGPLGRRRRPSGQCRGGPLRDRLDDLIQGGGPVSVGRASEKAMVGVPGRVGAPRHPAPVRADAGNQQTVGVHDGVAVTGQFDVGTGRGDQLTPMVRNDLAGTPVLLVNPRVAVATGPVFRGWDGVDRGALDPAAFSEDGGPSIAERMLMSHRILWDRADNARVARRGALGGWDQMRSRMIGEDEDRPMVVCFSTCEDSIRTIPIQQHDEGNVEDIDTDGEDHASDEWRYACMSRPYVKDAPGQPAPKFPQHQTIDEIIKRHQRKMQEA